MSEFSSNFMLAIGFTVVVIVLVVGTFITHLIISGNQLRKDKIALSAAQEQLLAYNKKLQAMAEHEALVEEEQRRKIAEELHDGIGQTLAFSLIKLSGLRKEKRSHELPPFLTELEGHIEHILKKVRSLTIELSPPALHNLGPAAAIETLAKHYQENHDFRIIINDDGVKKQMDKKMALFSYRAARELFANIFKHAKTKQMWVDLKNTDDRFRIKIKDNGVGFDPDEVHSKMDGDSFGLFNIKDRLNHYGGSMTVESRPGKGSQIVIEVPLKELKKGSDENQSFVGR